MFLTRLLLTASVLMAGTAFAAEPIRHTVSIPEPTTHYVEIRSTFPVSNDQDTMTVFMAVWTPGSYLVREFSRQVENVRFFSPQGELLPSKKISKNRWQVKTRGNENVVMDYRVYAREMSVRTSFVDSDFALLGPASLFFVPVNKQNLPHIVDLELPTNWPDSASGLQRVESIKHGYRAENYDDLVDSPIVAGDLKRYEFIVRGKKHALVNVLEGKFWNGEKAASDVEKLVKQHAEFWGGLPYEKKYLFLNLIVQWGGGLEHKNSTVLMTNRWAMSDRESYIDWLDLVSHEFFHTWNVKRLRPVALGPFDYEDENYTRSLWIAEGFTSYYSGLLNHRAGLITQDEYLELLAGEIYDISHTPGRFVRSAAEASFDAWIKYYRPDENSVNTGVSYYTKGAVIAFLLDTRIRAVTNNKKSLDDVMRLAYTRYADEAGYTPEQFRAVVADVANEDVAQWLYQASYTSSDLDFNKALAWYGLTLDKTAEDEDSDDEGKNDPWNPQPAWLGVELDFRGNNLIIEQIKRGTPAYKAGLNVGDELIAIDDIRITEDNYKDRMKHYPPQSEVRVTFSRRGELRELNVTLGAKPAEKWELKIVENPSEAQKARLESWLK
ncbi:MAG TPA: PDZ domain-containing protein [Gammaproteobacteria bacterium]|nr:PDZ domain-containing protein [Gammaproteobacteria bacterium]